MDGIIESLYINRELYSLLFLPVCAKYDVTMTEMLVLLFLAKNARCDTATDIVEKLKLAKSHVSASVRDLEERGYVEGSHAGHDRRTIHLRLCDGAAEIIREGKKIQEEFLAVVSRGFTEEERETCMRYVRRMNENANEYLRERLQARKG